MTPKRKAQLAAAGAAASIAVAAAILTQPSGPLTVHPGDDVARAVRGCKPGSVLTFVPGRYAGQTTLDGLRNVTLNCTGAVFSGGVVALKLTNFQGVTINGGEFTGAQLYGLMAQNGSGLTLNGPNAHSNGKTGILTASVDGVAINGGHSSDNAAEHGIYLSERCRTARITGTELDRNGKSACQINADKGRASDIQLTGLTCDGNQRVGGAAAIQLAYVDGGSVTDCTITNHQGRAGIALFWTTKDVDVERNSIQFAAGKGAANVSLDKSAGQNTIGANRYDSRVKGVVKE